MTQTIALDIYINKTIEKIKNLCTCRQAMMMMQLTYLSLHQNGLTT